MKALLRAPLWAWICAFALACTNGSRSSSEDDASQAPVGATADAGADGASGTDGNAGAEGDAAQRDAAQRDAAQVDGARLDAAQLDAAQLDAAQSDATSSRSDAASQDAQHSSDTGTAGDGSPSSSQDASADGSSAGCAAGMLTCGSACRAPDSVDACGACDNQCGIDCVGTRCARVVSLAAGGEHTCAVMNDGTVYCWGYNKLGQAGGAGLNLLPFQVPADRIASVSPPLSNVRKVAAGRWHTCVLRFDGRLLCWGSSQNVLGGAVNVNGVEPVLQDGARAVDLFIGVEHSCVITDAGGVQCWGSNTYGQMGLVPVGSTPSAVTAFGTKPVDMALGFKHTCALLTDGRVQCRGTNTEGQLGNGTYAMSYEPIEVSGLPARAVSIAAGVLHSCAATADGEVYCWGDNSKGQLGGATPAKSSTPVKVASISDAVQISALGTHTCALRRSGRVYCWGDNEFSKLASTPLEGVVAVSAGESHSCALGTTGSVHCWGANYANQSGSSSSATSLTQPFRVLWSHRFRTVCRPPERRCDGEKVLDCASDGYGWQPSGTVCTDAAGLHCSMGRCEPRVCDPATVACREHALAECVDNGFRWAQRQACTSEQHCDAQSLRCERNVCVPNAASCLGDSASTCNADGSAFASSGVDCTLSGRRCAEGRCVSPLVNLDFEAASLAGWSDLDGRLSIEGTSAAPGGTRSARLFGTDNERYMPAYQTGPLAPTYARVWVRTNAAGVIASFRLSGINNTKVIDIVFGNGTIRARSASTPMQLGAWYLMEIKDMDWTNKVYDLYVDGVLIGTDLTMDAWAEGFSSVSLHHDISSHPLESWFDDILIY